MKSKGAKQGCNPPLPAFGFLDDSVAAMIPRMTQ